jgi:hypothetical protein
MFIRDNFIPSSESMLCKDYYSKDSIAKRRNSLVVSLEELAPR